MCALLLDLWGDFFKNFIYIYVYITKKRGNNNGIIRATKRQETIAYRLGDEKAPTRGTNYIKLTNPTTKRFKRSLSLKDSKDVDLSAKTLLFCSNQSPHIRTLEASFHKIPSTLCNCQPFKDSNHPILTCNLAHPL